MSESKIIIIKTNAAGELIHQELTAGKGAKLVVMAGDKYRIVEIFSDGKEVLLDNMLVKKDGANLILLYANGISIYLEDFYFRENVSIFLPTEEDELELSSTAASSAVDNIADGVLYTAEDYFELVDKEENDFNADEEISEVSETNESNQSSEVGDVDADAGIFTWGNIGLGGLGLGIITGGGGGSGGSGGGGNGNDNNDNNNDTPTSLTGFFTAGKYTSGGDKAVEIFKADGSGENIGTASLDNNGRYTVTLTGNNTHYTGPIYVQLASSVKHKNEATDADESLGINLYAVAIIGSDSNTVNINVQTTIAYEVAGGSINVTMSKNTIDYANTLTQEALGLEGNILTTRIDTINSKGDEAGSKQAGYMAAAISGMGIPSAINEISADLKDKGALDTDTAGKLVAGAAVVDAKMDDQKAAADTAVTTADTDVATKQTTYDNAAAADKATAKTALDTAKATQATALTRQQDYTEFAAASENSKGDFSNNLNTHVVKVKDIKISNDTGKENDDFITKTSTQTITATLESSLETSQKLWYSINNGATWLDTEHTTGTTISIATTLNEGDSRIQFAITPIAVDGSDITPTTVIANKVGAIAKHAYTLDISPPTAPTNLNLDDASDTGNKSDNMTKTTNALIINGTAEAGSTINVYTMISDTLTLLGTGTTTYDGTFTISTNTTLSAGTHNITAKAIDIAGNESNVSTDLSITIDTTPPTLTAPSATLTLGENKNVVLNFSENITAGTGNIEIWKVADNGGADTKITSIDIADNTGKITITDNQLSINPSNSFAEGDYYIKMASGVITDTTGNDFAGISTTTAWPFNVETNSHSISTVGALATAATTGVDALSSGHYWDLSTDREITYSFNLTAPSNYSNVIGVPGISLAQDWLALNTAQKKTVKTIFSEIEKLLNIKFTEVADTPSDSDGDIQFNISNTGSKSAAFAYYPGDFANYAGDIFLSTDFNSSNRYSLEPGGGGWGTIIHEIGHAMGLKHPFSSSPTLPTATDNTNHTVMSYTWTEKVATVTAAPFGAYYYSSKILFPELYSLYDVATLQSIYGANLNTNKDNTTYTYQYDDYELNTIWDTGGIDTIDLSMVLGSNTIDLNPGTLNSADERTLAQIADLVWTGDSDYDDGVLEKLTKQTNLYTGKDNLSIATGTIIENILTGVGNDKITDNLVDNIITTGAGNDKIYIGNGGYDTIDGGAGNDTLYINSKQAEVVYTSAGSDEYGRLSALTYTAQFKGIETLIFNDGTIVI